MLKVKTNQLFLEHPEILYLLGSYNMEWIISGHMTSPNCNRKYSEIIDNISLTNEYRS